MRLRVSLVSTCALAATAAVLAPGVGAAVHECAPGNPTAASYTWDFKAEANSSFQDLETLGRQTRDDADQLVTYNRGHEVDWEIQADQLHILKHEVNDMGTRLCRLEMIRRVLEPWQQAEVDRIAQQVQLIADNTADAIVYLASHEHDLWVPTYQKYANHLYKEAGSLTQSLSDAVTYASVSKQYQDLRHKLSVPAAS